MILAILPERALDAYGSGYYGASRGERLHNGIDFACYPGSKIFSTVSGVVTKIGFPYADDLSYRYVQVTDDHEQDHRFFYVDPIVKTGDIIHAGLTIIGHAQDISARYTEHGQMTNHVHYEVKQEGRYINPSAA